MRAIAIAFVVGACYSPTPPAGVPCGENDVCPSGQQCVAGFCGGSGGMVDSDVIGIDMTVIDAAPVCATWNARHFDPCAIPAPMGDLNLTQALSGFGWNTDTGELKGKMNTTIPVTTVLLTQTGGPDVRLASVDNLTLDASATLDINGDLPLLIAVWGTASIAGDIDASASFTVARAGGAAGQTTECGSAPTGNGGAMGTPSNGGGGGAFQGDGGRGGNASGGAGVAIAVPTVIRGGCAGGTGGASASLVSGPRGAGGGAIQITARVSIEILSGGSIGAGGGAGGYGRAAYGAGGAGGSGGYIGLDAPILTVTGTLAANGGGGGGGGSDVGNGTSGSNGATSGNAAVGGPGATATNIGACGKGGNGSFGGTLDAQNGVSSACGGGGGGGGAGYILLWSPTTNVTGTVSPPALSGP